ncbi:MAG: winged helix-turn-helix domain-containing protein [Candidatus Bathyarchaeota archaeon]|nr:winged helix-turn-helix domain-containing protein [Candidatus Bathyarchaeota archaeon]
MKATLASKTKRRDQFGIMAKILEITKKGARKTQIMYKANLSFTQLNDYLPYLLNKKLISLTCNGDVEIYVITKNGIDFLKRHNELIQLLKTCSTIQKSTIQTHIV